jgi:hypothetical protein
MRNTNWLVNQYETYYVKSKPCNTWFTLLAQKLSIRTAWGKDKTWGRKLRIVIDDNSGVYIMSIANVCDIYSQISNLRLKTVYGCSS